MRVLDRQVDTSSIVPAAAARRLLLAGQGLLDDPGRPATPAAVQRVVETLGFVQVDSINVLDRAHHLTLRARLHSYKPETLSLLLERRRSLFEHWTHDASIIPTRWLEHWKPRFARYRQRIRGNRWWQARLGADPDALIEQVRGRVAHEGPLLSRDFERDGHGELPAEKGWWGWKPQKAALEHLWRCGELAIARRINFNKVFDMMERVLPQLGGIGVPDEREHIEWACWTALERLGIATPGELAAFWRAVDPSAARRWCAQALKDRRIIRVQVPSASGQAPFNAVAPAHWSHMAARLADPPPGIRLLPPFDPILRDRRRALHMFGFDYRFEAFVPRSQRRYGYYVMPLLERDRLVGRIDPKFNRQRGVLEVRGLWWEPGVAVTKARRRALACALEAMAQAIGARSIEFLTR